MLWDVFEAYVVERAGAHVVGRDRGPPRRDTIVECVRSSPPRDYLQQCIRAPSVDDFS